MPDVHTPLATIAQSSNLSLVQHLIQIQKFRQDKVKSAQWAENLEVLSFTPMPTKSTMLDSTKRSIDRCRTSSDDYLALSYVWKPSSYEPSISHSFYVKSRDDVRNWELSPVRDSIWQRVQAYMEYRDISYVWVDQESIDQSNSHEKQIAMQSMDLVYKKAQHSLALLTVSIDSQKEIDLLASLLSGDLVRSNRKRKRNAKDGPFLADEVDACVAAEVIDLLVKITSDPWWERAWCFQEEYLAEKDMQLLIPHRAGLQKEYHSNCFGDMLEDELVVNSHSLRRTLTMFCIAYINSASSMTLSPRMSSIQQIISRAARYTTLADFGHVVGYDNAGRAMSTQILRDIASRGLRDPFDIISITANCCRYSLTMDTNDLQKQKQNLSLCLLALYFMNGEVFWNDTHSNGLGANQDVFQYIRSISFDRFAPPIPYGELSYMKRYRHVSPKICEDGLETSGLLWQIDEMLTPVTPRQVRQNERKYSLPNGDHSVELGTLYCLLDSIEDVHEELWSRLRDFLQHSFSSNPDHSTKGGTPMMSLMAFKLARVALAGERLGVGHMVRNDPKSSAAEETKLGIFVLPRVVTRSRPLHTFVTWQPGEELRKTYQHQPDADKFLSLEVEVTSDHARDPGAHLITKNWVHCLPFFKGEKLKRYLFPWPASLQHT